jgi:hypothetical protein
MADKHPRLGGPLVQPKRSKGSRLRQIGWNAVPVICLALFLALSFQVNAVKREVLLAERQIIALEREKMMLETEFQTRASQRQLAQWNALEFGYKAPNAGQFLESERQLAALGTPRAVSAPDPIRVAMAPMPTQEHFLPDWARGLAEIADDAMSDDADTAPQSGSRSGGDSRADIGPDIGPNIAPNIAQRLTNSAAASALSNEAQP